MKWQTSTVPVLSCWLRECSSELRLSQTHPRSLDAPARIAVHLPSPLPHPCCAQPRHIVGAEQRVHPAHHQPRGSCGRCCCIRCGGCLVPRAGGGGDRSNSACAQVARLSGAAEALSRPSVRAQCRRGAQLRRESRRSSLLVRRVRLRGLARAVPVCADTARTRAAVAVPARERVRCARPGGVRGEGGGRAHGGRARVASAPAQRRRLQASGPGGVGGASVGGRQGPDARVSGAARARPHVSQVAGKRNGAVGGVGARCAEVAGARAKSRCAMAEHFDIRGVRAVARAAHGQGGRGGARATRTARRSGRRDSPLVRASSGAAPRARNRHQGGVEDLTPPQPCRLGRVARQVAPAEAAALRRFGRSEAPAVASRRCSARDVGAACQGINAREEPSVEGRRSHYAPPCGRCVCNLARHGAGALQTAAAAGAHARADASISSSRCIGRVVRKCRGAASPTVRVGTCCAANSAPREWASVVWLEGSH